MTPAKTVRIPLALILALFFSSGALALVYEVVWSRMMMHVFGSTAVAVGTVLAAYMSGLAVGAWLIGRAADRSANCLRLYAWLEIGVALAALLSHVLLSRLGAAHLAIYELVGSSAALFAPTRFLLAFGLVMAPTVLMGATLPVLTRFLASREDLLGVKLSTLYSVNTFGAVAGVLLTGFFLIGRYGIHIPVYLAVAGNLAIGFIAWMLSSRAAESGDRRGGADAKHAEHSAVQGAPVGAATYRIVLIGLGLSGFTSFAYEIYWTRSLVFILGNSTYALTAMLSAFLSGIALGGYLVRFLIRRISDRAALFGWIQLSLGVFSALALPLLFLVSDPQALNRYMVGTSDQAFSLLAGGYGIAFLVMLLPATLIGATFPLVGQIAARDLEETGATVGRIYAINTLGNVLGALLPGLFLLAWLGIQKGILAMAAINTALGFTILFLRLAKPPGRVAWRLALPLLLVVTVFLLGRAPLQFQFPSDGEQADFQTLFYREGPLATTKVYLNPSTGEKHMSVDGIVIGGTGFSEFKQLLLAHLPKLLITDVSTELSVGIGSGILLGESLLHPQVRNMVGVEIEPSVIEGAGWFENENHSLLDNPKLEVVTDDISSFLRTRFDQFQVVSADEKTADEYASNGFSYSQDYYRLLSDHLALGGLVAQWVPTTLPPRQYRMVLKTFTESFPHVQLWYFLPAHKRGPFNTILIGSNEPVPLDFDRIEQRFAENPDAFQNLAPYGLTSAQAVLPHFVAGETHIAAAVADDPVNSLDHPRYEFFHPWDYAREREAQIIENHAFIIDLKRRAFADFMDGLQAGEEDKARLRRTQAAELRYLFGFLKFLEGAPLDEQVRILDDALKVAPWNDSLRARIYAQYDYFASSHPNPAERSRMRDRAENLYKPR